MPSEYSSKDDVMKFKKTQEIKNQIPTSLKADIFYASKIRQYKIIIELLEQNIKSLNEQKKSDTGVIAGIGDWIGNSTGAYTTGKQIYEQNLKNIQQKALELQKKFETELEGKELSDTNIKEIKSLLSRFETISHNKIKDISWATAVFNDIGIEEISGDTGSLKNRAKIFGRTVISTAEGAYEATVFVLHIAGKALGITAAYVASSLTEGKFDSSVGKQITTDVQEIFNTLTVENAEKVLAMLPGALESFGNLSPEEQADGFGKFFGNLLVGAGIGVKVFTSGKHALKLGGRAIRMAQHKGIKTAPRLALAGSVQGVSGVSAIGAGAVLRVAEFNILPGKKRTEKVVDSVTKQQLKKESQILKIKNRSGATPEIVEKNSKLSDSERLAEAEKILRNQGYLDATESLTENQKILILAGHNAAKYIPAYEHTFGSIREKARASAGLPKAWKKQLMDFGIMREAITGTEKTWGLKISEEGMRYLQDIKITEWDFKHLFGLQVANPETIDILIYPPRIQVKFRDQSYGEYYSMVLNKNEKKLDYISSTAEPNWDSISQQISIAQKLGLNSIGIKATAIGYNINVAKNAIELGFHHENALGEQLFHKIKHSLLQDVSMQDIPGLTGKISNTNNLQELLHIREGKKAFDDIFIEHASDADFQRLLFSDMKMDIKRKVIQKIEPVWLQSTQPPIDTSKSIEKSLQLPKVANYDIYYQAERKIIEQLDPVVLDLLPSLKKMNIYPEALVDVDINTIHKILQSDRSEKISQLFDYIFRPKELRILAEIDLSVLDTAIILKQNGINISTINILEVQSFSRSSINNLIASGKIAILQKIGIKPDFVDLGSLAKLDKSILEEIIQSGKLDLISQIGTKPYIQDLALLAKLDKSILEEIIQSGKLDRIKKIGLDPTIKNLDIVHSISLNDLNKVTLLADIGINIKHVFELPDLKNTNDSMIELLRKDHKKVALIRDINSMTPSSIRIENIPSIIALPSEYLEIIVHVLKRTPGIHIGRCHEWKNFAQYSDEKLKYILSLKDQGIIDQRSGVTISQLMKLDVSILGGINKINDVELQKSILETFLSIIDLAPNFRYSGETSLNALRDSLQNHLDLSIIAPQTIDRFMGNDSWKTYIDKMFRINEFSTARTQILGNGSGILKTEKGFFMNQQIGDCYLIAALNALRTNPHFTESLYKNITYIKHNNPGDCKWGYHFPDGKYIEVSVREMKTIREVEIPDPFKYLSELTGTEKEKVIKKIAHGIMRSGQKSDKGIVDSYGLILPKLSLEKYRTVDEIGVERFTIPQELITQIGKDIEAKSGTYYDYAIKYLSEPTVYRNVDAPLGYKVLEALYSKYVFGSVDKIKLEGGFSESVLRDFLPEDIWKLAQTFKTNSPTSVMLIKKSLENIDNFNCIMTCSIKVSDTPNNYAYFSYKGHSFADKHAYSVIGYDRINKIVKVVNPWENTKIIDMRLDDFFKIFSDVTIAIHK